MANSISGHFNYSGKQLLAVIVPELRKDGMYYEVNIDAFPRFFMKWSELGRYDIVENNPSIPYDLTLLISDLLERNVRKRK